MLEFGESTYRRQVRGEGACVSAAWGWLHRQAVHADGPVGLYPGCESTLPA